MKNNFLLATAFPLTLFYFISSHWRRIDNLLEDTVLCKERLGNLKQMLVSGFYRSCFSPICK